MHNCTHIELKRFCRKKGGGTGCRRYWIDTVQNLVYTREKKRKEEVSMKLNMGSPDRIIRFVIAILIAILLFANVLKGALAIILGIIAIIFIITSIIGFCPLYVLLGLSTKKRGKSQ